MKTLLLLFAAGLMTVVAAKENYRVTLFQPSVVAGTELEAGDYQLTVDNERVTFKKGRKTVEATVKTETAPDKYKSTTVRYDNGDGKLRVAEIRLGGTNQKLVFN
ncbi:MAG: hypothetical protein KIT09_30635 [Bryobacteraceae bacterium]|nr:hypothetical protein [Bryobacteraceae bacterium]